jgi:hypothetical protein
MQNCATTFPGCAFDDCFPRRFHNAPAAVLRLIHTTDNGDLGVLSTFNHTGFAMQKRGVIGRLKLDQPVPELTEEEDAETLAAIARFRRRSGAAADVFAGRGTRALIASDPSMFSGLRVGECGWRSPGFIKRLKHDMLGAEKMTNVQLYFTIMVAACFFALNFLAIMWQARGLGEAHGYQI